jgi:hypothetical protein
MCTKLNYSYTMLYLNLVIISTIVKYRCIYIYLSTIVIYIYEHIFMLNNYS